ncbi:MAG: caspase family protein [Desulfobacterales bacterium]|nr:caspase family protein [Desulfobacterales bacterium]
MKNQVWLLILFCIIMIFWMGFGVASQENLISNSDDKLLVDFKSALTPYWNNDYQHALTLFQKMISTYPTFTTAYIYLADCLKATGKVDEAKQYYQQACTALKEKQQFLKTDIPELKGRSGTISDIVYCLNSLGLFEEAKQTAMMAVMSEPSPDLYINLSYAFYKLGNTALAQFNFCQSKKIQTTKEIDNLVYHRLKGLSEAGNDWAFTCKEDVVEKKAGTNYALIIAIGRYQDPGINPLNYAENDARELYKVLTDSRTGMFKPENITILINEKATEKNVKFKFDDISMQASQEGDMVFIFYAGHGFAYPEGTDTYWLTYDTILGDSSYSRIRSSAFSNLTLASKLAEIKAKTVVFFIDACFSSGMLNTTKSIRGLETYLGSDKNYVIITSSQADQKSIESPSLKHGIFSYFLINGLYGNADTNKDGWVEIEEIWPYLKNSVADMAKKMGQEQLPRRSGSSGGTIYLSINPNR